MATNVFVIFAVFVLLALYISQNQTVCEKFESTTEQFSNLFEPNMNMVSVEAFGDEEGMGYYDGAGRMKNVRVTSTGPPAGGTQLAGYQLYQQAVNASTPNMEQLENISNMSGHTNPNSPGMPPYANTFGADAAKVDFGTRRAELISPCAQNAPTFVASSLLPKMNLPGAESWNVHDTKALANQDFLSATQQIGVDTVLSSLRNPSYDIRNNIPNPINVVSPWLNSTITPDLTKRPLDAVSEVPTQGIYSGSPGVFRSYGWTGQRGQMGTNPTAK